ncbi:hypothetical protein NC652_013382 [Populus alba x Populus x berolinensis]|nr:hypothetical protein NC652_013382 [Populus alba x Populus x berolinensis]
MKESESASKNVIQDHFPKMRKPGARTRGPPRVRGVDQMLLGGVKCSWHASYRTSANGSNNNL